MKTKSPFNYRDYWNTKFQYFMKNEGAHSGRKDVPRFDAIISYLEFLTFSRSDILLDLGCGHGRLFPIFLNLVDKIYGVDVSDHMIEFAKEKYAENERVFLKRSDITNLDYPEDFFDKIICYGVFDGIYDQFKLIQTISSFLKPGGELFLSGKHKPYLESDSEAKIAEENAKLAGHPNVFTMDWDDFLEVLSANHLIAFKNLYFLNRGDMAVSQYLEEKPEKFYEYIIYLKKDETC